MWCSRTVRHRLDGATLKAPFTEHGGAKLVNSGPYNGLGVDDAIVAMAAHATEKGFGQARDDVIG